MPLGTLDRTPPPFFKQGTSALSKLMVFSALAFLLMVADGRFSVSEPLRATVATALHPLHWLVLQPVRLVQQVRGYVVSLETAQAGEKAARRQLAAQAERSLQLEESLLENQRLRRLLDMRERVSTRSVAAQVLYDTADPYTRRVIIDRGLTHGVRLGAPVVDETGVVGQVTQVYPLLAEVTLLIDRNQAIPVLNVRTGVRGVAYGQPGSGGGMELRYTLANADISEGDLLTTSGVDGVYPPGLPVARISQVERRSESTFTRILCQPLARMSGALHVLVLEPVELEPRPPTSSPNRAHPAGSGSAS